MVSVTRGSLPPLDILSEIKFHLPVLVLQKEDREPVSGGETRLAGGTTFFHITEHFGSAN